MPSPFPGMDPYLEDPLQWESFHNRLIGMLDELLSARVRPHFYVAQQSAVYLVEPGGMQRRPPVKPDVFLVTAAHSQTTLLEERAITAPTILKARYPEEIRQRYLEIRDRASRTVVAVIEVLSPTNKSGAGAAQFDQKRQEVMASPVHWLEIDLLRAGQRFPPVAGRSDYCILLKRGDQPAPPPIAGASDGEETEFAVWFVNLRDVLPVVAVPLTPAFPDVALDLQTAFTTVYDRFYLGQVTYAVSPPPPPLAPADAAWAEERIRVWQVSTTTE